MIDGIEDFLSCLVRELNPSIKTQRWFGSKSHTIVNIRVADYCVEHDPEQTEMFVVLKFELEGELTEHYLVPLVIKEHGELAEHHPLLRLRHRETEFDVFDGLNIPRFCLKILKHMSRSDTLKTVNGKIDFFSDELSDSSLKFEEKAVNRVGSEQSNTSVVFGRKYIYKSYRRMVEGTNPDYEVPLFLIKNGFDATPKPLGGVVYRGSLYESSQIGSLFSYVENQGDGWSYLTHEIAVIASKLQGETSQGQISPRDQSVESTMATCSSLGELTARLHCVLASNKASPEFRPEPVTSDDLREWSEDFLLQMNGLFETLSKIDSALPDDKRALVERLFVNKDKFEQLANGLGSSVEPDFNKIRIHGDYHLGQVLKTAAGFTVIDFEGEPARTIEYRRRKRCAVIDVSGMLRSFSYASNFVAKNIASRNANEVRANWAKIWYEMAANTFLQTYWETSESRGASHIPRSFIDFNRLVKFFVAEKAVYELSYELNNRPDWADIPATALIEIVD